MTKGYPLVPVASTGDVQGGRQRSPHMTEGKLVPYLRVANVFDGHIDFSDVNEMAFKSHEIDRFRLLKGDILLNEGQSVELVGRCAMFMDGPEECCYQNTLVRYRAGPETDPRFALHLFRHCQLTGVFSRIAVRTNSIAHLGVSRFAELELPFPPYPVQLKIADILDVWDAALQKAEQLIAAKERHLAHSRARLLHNPERALPTKLRDVTKELTARNGTSFGRDAIMAVTKQVGMRPMREETIAAGIERYKRVPPRAFAYNPMRLNIGSIAMSSFDHEVLVSPDYVVFECDNSKLIPSYLDHLRYSQRWKSHFELAGNGSVRVRIYYDDLGRFTLLLPPVDVQARLVRLLDAAWDEITLLKRNADALRTQKRGLMQKLLTGKWRLPVHTETS